VLNVAKSSLSALSEIQASSGAAAAAAGVQLDTPRLRQNFLETQYFQQQIVSWTLVI